VPVAISLSGGGAKGDFQVGALRYLYDRGIRPDILCGVSVGAVNAARLATVASPAGPEQKDAALRSLEAIWRGLNTDADMWRREAWLVALERAKRDATEFGIALLSPIAPLRPFGLLGAGSALIADLNVLSGLPNARSLYNLAPIDARLRDPALLDPTLVGSSGMRLRLGTVSLSTGKVRYVTESGALVERDGTPVEGPVERLPPDCQDLAEKVRLKSEELDMAQQDLVDAAAEGLATGHIRTLIATLTGELGPLEEQLRTCLTTNAGTRLPVVVNLREAVLASASIPAFFPPVRLALGDHYVDGGVREIVPIQVALDAGATEVYAIAASRVGVNPDGDYLSPTFDEPRGLLDPVLVDLVERTVDLFLDEILLTDAEPRRGWPEQIVVIEPSLDPELHDIMTIEPGLIDIAMAYGYMRAWDVLEGDRRAPAEAQALRGLTDAIVALRKRIWELEFAINGKRRAGFYFRRGEQLQPAPDGGPLPELRGMLRQLAVLVRERQARGGCVPIDARWWPESWHRHEWSPMTGTPWDAWTFTQQTAPAGSPPMGNEPPAAAAFAGGRVDVVGIGLDHGMFHKSWDGAAWTPAAGGWTPFGGTFSSPPAACAWANGRLEVFGRGLDRQLYHRSWSAGTFLQGGWEPLGGGMTGPPNVVAWSENRMDIFALGFQRECLHKAWDGSAWRPTQADWEDLGGTFTTAPVAVAWQPGRLDVFGLGLNSGLFHRAWDGSAWMAAWEPLGGVLRYGPSVVAWGPNRLDVFAIGIDGGMYHKAWDGNAWRPSPTGWESLGGVFTGAPAAVAWGPGRLDVFGVGLDRAIYHKAWDGSAWRPSLTDWERFGGAFTSDPVVVSSAPGRLDVFAYGLDRGLFHKAWDGSAWLPSPLDWEALGGTFAE
jgi:predicted acylesterase/phospholipase RssA